MGCICSKGRNSPNDYVAENIARDKDTKGNRISKHLSSVERVAIEVDGNGNDVTTRLISNPSRGGTSGSGSGSSDEGEKNGEIESTTAKPVKQLVHMASNMGIGNGGEGQAKMASIVTVPKGERGAQVLAGWPSWLTAVAGEAINGWIPRRADSYEKLDKVS